MNSVREKIFIFVAVALIIGWSGNFGLAEENHLAAVLAGDGVSRTPTLPAEPPLFVLSSPMVPGVAAELPVAGEGEGGEIGTTVPAQQLRQMASIIEPAPGALAPEESSLRPAAYRPSGNIVLPSVAAEAAYLADLETGESYFDHHAKQRRPIASITKLMTAVIALDVFPPETEMTIVGEDFPPEDTSVDKKFKPGERYAAADLIEAILIVSSNEAAETLAREAGRTAFLARMNSRAKEWGMGDTYFTDPTGLSSANQSTAADLQKLAAHIFATYPTIFETSRKEKVSVLELGTVKRQTLTNINLFAGEAWFLGGKTGYTDDAGGNLLTIFSHSRRPVVAVVLGTADRFGESERLIDWFAGQYKLAR